MYQLTNEIIASREWRFSELENLKKIALVSLSNSTQKTKEQFYRMTIPYIYAHWEGFVIESFKQLATYLNNQNIERRYATNELFYLV